MGEDVSYTATKTGLSRLVGNGTGTDSALWGTFKS
jgi:hypothetical protein